MRVESVDIRVRQSRQAVTTTGFRWCDIVAHDGCVNLIGFGGLERRARVNLFARQLCGVRHRQEREHRVGVFALELVASATLGETDDGIVGRLCVFVGERCTSKSVGGVDGRREKVGKLLLRVVAAGPVVLVVVGDLKLSYSRI